MTVHAAVSAVRARIFAAAKRVGRDPGEVLLVAVTKGVGPDAIGVAARAGVRDVGENRAQEMREKQPVVSTDIRWHFLGEVQTNKVRYLDRVHVVHSLDRPQEAEALQRRGEATGRSWDVLVEVNVAGESSKQGIRPGDLGVFLERLGAWPLVRPRGLMVLAPRCEDPEEVRWVFAEARRLRDRHRDAVAGLEELSMGMSDDFEVAIEEGATMVRIGRAIFRPRPAATGAGDAETRSPKTGV